MARLGATMGDPIDEYMSYNKCMETGMRRCLRALQYLNLEESGKEIAMIIKLEQSVDSMSVQGVVQSKITKWLQPHAINI